MNLAGVLPWTHWRAITVIGLLAIGNLFCMACPFTFVRDMGRKILPARLRWPRALSSKWLAAGLVAPLPLGLRGVRPLGQTRDHCIDHPRVFSRRTRSSTDSLRGASFCKFVCPIGQFHFVQSLASPFEVKVRRPDICASCRTFDCIKGQRLATRMRTPAFSAAQIGQHGLHVLPRLHQGVSARQRRHSCGAAGR